MKFDKKIQMERALDIVAHAVDPIGAPKKARQEGALVEL